MHHFFTEKPKAIIDYGAIVAESIAAVAGAPALGLAAILAVIAGDFWIYWQDVATSKEAGIKSLLSQGLKTPAQARKAWATVSTHYAVGMLFQD